MESFNNDIVQGNIAAASDRALLKMIGSFLKEARVKQNKTQQEVADAAGIFRTTVVKIENGSGGTMLSFIQIMRAIDQLYIFKNFEIPDRVSPLQLAKMMQHKKQRGGYLKKPGAGSKIK